MLLTIGLFFYWADYSGIVEMGAEQEQRLGRRLAFLESVFGADISIQLSLPLAQRGDLSSDPSGLGPL